MYIWHQYCVNIECIVVLQYSIVRFITVQSRVANMLTFLLTTGIIFVVNKFFMEPVITANLEQNDMYRYYML